MSFQRIPVCKSGNSKVLLELSAAVILFLDYLNGAELDIAFLPKQQIREGYAERLHVFYDFWFQGIPMIFNESASRKDVILCIINK